MGQTLVVPEHSLIENTERQATFFSNQVSYN